MRRGFNFLDLVTVSKDTIFFLYPHSEFLYNKLSNGKTAIISVHIEKRIRHNIFVTSAIFSTCRLHGATVHKHVSVIILIHVWEMGHSAPRRIERYLPI